jgi:hypothetical protein
MVLNEKETAVDISGWVTLENRAGTRFAKASIHLLAGATRYDPNRKLAYGHQYYKQLTRETPTSQRGRDLAVSFGEYWLYKLPEKTNVANNQIKQIELISVENVPVKKTYLYDGAKVTWHRHVPSWKPEFGREENKKVHVLFELENRAQDNLGIALPAGKCRVYKADRDKSLEFIGEDAFDHTPRDEKVTLYIGDAFDLVGQRKQTHVKRVTDRIFEEAFEIKVRNHKKEPVTVRVIEKLYRHAAWKILQKSQDFEQLDSRTIVFPVEVAPDGEAVITYRVRYESSTPFLTGDTAAKSPTTRS